jgi:hypothetical protein
LQLGHDEPREVFVCSRYVRGGNDKSVTGTGKPFGPGYGNAYAPNYGYAPNYRYAPGYSIER